MREGFPYTVVCVIKGALGVQEVALFGQGKEWPGVPVAVVFQIKHAGKTCAGDFLLSPAPIWVLGALQEVDAAFYAFCFWITKGLQAHHCPRGL